MSTISKKLPSGTPENRMLSKDSTTHSPSRNPTRSTSTPSATPNGNIVARSRSFRSTNPFSSRNATQRNGAGAVKLSTTTTSSENNEKTAENLILDDINERLRKSEELSEISTKQLQTMQIKLDETIREKKLFEEQAHESAERIETLTNEKNEAIRQKREIEAKYEAEKVSTANEREESLSREKEMQTIIQRLKESLDSKMNGDEERQSIRRSKNTSPNIEQAQFSPQSGLNRSDSQNNSKLLLQKDRFIESLRLELAESQIKLVESENMGGDRLQSIEKQLLEARMTNAKLIEDNESYRLLLSEKTLQGDSSRSEPMGSPVHNADALCALEGRTEISNPTNGLSGSEGGHDEDYRRLEEELKVYKEKNKAFRIYINNIIRRISMNGGDIEAILEQSPDLQLSNSFSEKELPAPPKEVNGTRILQRAKTVALGATRRARPQSLMPPLSYSLVTDQGTAPSIPVNLNRSSSYRTNRPQSEQFTGGTGNITSQIFRGHHSPPLNGPQSPRQSQSFFLPPTPGLNPNAAHRAPPSGQTNATNNLSGIKSDSSSISGDSSEISTPPSNSPPRIEKATTFAGNKPRPLRLLQESGPSDSSRRAEDEAAVKFSKRSSWMGWAFGKKEDIHMEESQKIY